MEQEVFPTRSRFYQPARSSFKLEVYDGRKSEGWSGERLSTGTAVEVYFRYRTSTRFLILMFAQQFLVQSLLDVGRQLRGQPEQSFYSVGRTE